MTQTASLIPFLAASAALTLAPGPDIIFVATKSLAQGARAGLAVAAGLCTGVLLHVALAAFGISLIIRQSPIAFNAVRVAGTLYLLRLAFLAWKNRKTPPAESGAAGTRARLVGLFRTGALMSALNPKVILFFLAFLPQFVPADAPSPWKNLLLLGCVFDAQALAVFAVVSLCAGTLFRTLRERPRVSERLNALTALVLVAIAASLFFV